MNIKRKLLITFGSLASIIAPAAIISCSCSSKTSQADSNSSTGKLADENISPIEIKGNTFYYDVTKTNLADKALEESWNFVGPSDGMKWADINFKDEIVKLSNWYATQIANENSIKIAFTFYHKRALWTKVFKIDTKISKIKGAASFFGFFAAIFFETENVPAHLQDIIKRSDNIEDFHNQNW